MYEKFFNVLNQPTKLNPQQQAELSKWIKPQELPKDTILLEQGQGIFEDEYDLIQAVIQAIEDRNEKNNCTCQQLRFNSLSIALRITVRTFLNAETLSLLTVAR